MGVQAKKRIQFKRRRNKMNQSPLQPTNQPTATTQQPATQQPAATTPQPAPQQLPASIQQLNDLLTVAEVAAILRVDDTTVRRWVKQGVLEAVVLPHIHTRQGYRIKRETLNKLLGETTI
jgi:excisionase family DNA binding protein